MPVIAIRQQPAAASLNAAYRPISFEVEAQATDGGPQPPMVYCDIYVDGVFYRTVSRSIYTGQLAASTLYTFDIQDAVQECMDKVIGKNGYGDVLLTIGISRIVSCKFRASAMTGGLIVPELVVPKQGTWNINPLPGTGLSSNSFFVLNATLQHEDEQDLASHLSTLRKGIWKVDCYPLTHRPNAQKIGLHDSDYFPMFVSGTYENVRLVWKYIGESETRREKRLVTKETVPGAVVYVPTGPKNLNVLFTSINFMNVAEYFVELLDDQGIIIGTTTTFVPQSCFYDNRRIHFLNALGCIDAITFKLATVEGDIRSDSWQKGLGNSFSRTSHATQRFNVVSNRSYVAKTVDYNEPDMPWMEELFRTPMAWMEWKGSAFEPDSYTPIFIKDTKFPSLKEDDRYSYEVSLEFEPSHDFINLRN